MNEQTDFRRFSIEKHGKTLTTDMLASLKELSGSAMSPFAFEDLMLTGAIDLERIKPNSAQQKMFWQKDGRAVLKDFDPFLLWQAFLPPQTLVQVIGRHLEFLSLNLPNLELEDFGFYEQLASTLNSWSHANGLKRAFLVGHDMNKQEKIDMALWQLFDEYLLEGNIGGYFAVRPGCFRDAGFMIFPGDETTYKGLLDDCMAEMSTEPAQEYLEERIK